MLKVNLSLKTRGYSGIWWWNCWGNRVFERCKEVHY